MMALRRIWKPDDRILLAFEEPLTSNIQALSVEASMEGFIFDWACYERTIQTHLEDPDINSTISKLNFTEQSSPLNSKLLGLAGAPFWFRFSSGRIAKGSPGSKDDELISVMFQIQKNTHVYRDLPVIHSSREMSS